MTRRSKSSDDSDNSILSLGGLGKGWFILGFIGSFLWYYIHSAIEFILFRILFYQLNLRDCEEEFRWFNSWYAFHPYTLYGAKRVKPQSSNRMGGGYYGGGGRFGDVRGISDENESSSRVKFVPGLGLHFFYVKSKLIIARLSISRNNVQQPTDQESETVTLYIPCFEWMNSLSRYIYPCDDQYNNAPSVAYMLEMGGFPRSLIPPDTTSSNTSNNDTTNDTTSNTSNNNNNTTTNTSNILTNNMNQTAYYTFKELLDECYNVHDLISREKTVIYSPSGRGTGWNQSCVVEKRERNTVILNDGVWEDLYKDVSHFLSAKKWYKDRGIPYRRGYLLYGEPGNGKSSTISSLAASFNLNICVLSMGAQNMTDERLQQAFSSIPRNSIIVLEDIDSSFPNDDNDGNNTQQQQTQTVEVRGMTSIIKTAGKATFSCLLNCLDGIGSQESRIVMMTTNFKDKLPASLLRNGRVDRKIYLGNTTPSQLKRLAKNFYPQDYNEELAQLLVERLNGFTYCMAQLQGFFLRNSNSFEGVVEASKDFTSYLKEEETQQSNITNNNMIDTINNTNGNGNGNNNGGMIETINNNNTNGNNGGGRSMIDMREQDRRSGDDYFGDRDGSMLKEQYMMVRGGDMRNGGGTSERRSRSPPRQQNASQQLTKRPERRRDSISTTDTTPTMMD